MSKVNILKSMFIALLIAGLAVVPVSAQEVQEVVIENPCEDESLELIDVNENDIHDACEEIEEVEVTEETEEEEVTTPEENVGNVPKGEVSPETVAGTEEVNTGAVLGTSTEPAVLAETGSTPLLSLLIATLLITSTSAVYSRK